MTPEEIEILRQAYLAAGRALGKAYYAYKKASDPGFARKQYLKTARRRRSEARRELRARTKAQITESRKIPYPKRKLNEALDRAIAQREA